MNPLFLLGAAAVLLFSGGAGGKKPLVLVGKPASPGPAPEPKAESCLAEFGDFVLDLEASVSSLASYWSSDFVGEPIAEKYMALWLPYNRAVAAVAVLAVDGKVRSPFEKCALAGPELGWSAAERLAAVVACESARRYRFGGQAAESFFVEARKVPWRNSVKQLLPGESSALFLALSKLTPEQWRAPYSPEKAAGWGLLVAKGQALFGFSPAQSNVGLFEAMRWSSYAGALAFAEAVLA